MADEFKGLYRVQKKDIKACGEALTDAFLTDPKWSRLFKKLNHKQMSAFYQEPVSYCMRYGQVYTPSENIEGIMAIVPGRYSEMTAFRVMMTCTTSILFQGGLPLLKFLGELDSTFDPLEESRRKIMKDREHLYLFIIGIKQDMQSKGFGSKMLTSFCEYADRLKQPIYLETATENNVEFYKKHGFKITEEIIHPDFDMKQWGMIREV